MFAMANSSFCLDRRLFVRQPRPVAARRSPAEKRHDGSPREAERLDRVTPKGANLSVAFVANGAKSGVNFQAY
jgi:hypothetical protein